MLTKISTTGDSVELTETIFIVDVFQSLYTKVREQDGKDAALACFAYMHFMYWYDSPFIQKYPTIRERTIAVKKFIANGDKVEIGKPMKAAIKVYKWFVDEDSTSTFITMKNKIMELKTYLAMIRLYAPPPTEDGPDLEAGIDYMVVDYKEYDAVTSMLPRKQKELTDYEEQLKNYAASQVNAYGSGGALGAFE